MVNKTGTYRRCLYFNQCFKDETHDGTHWKEDWARDKKGNLVCYKHFLKYVKKRIRPRYHNKKWQSRRIVFLGKRIHLSFDIRTGYCSLCTNNVFDKSIKRTNMHHWFYLPIMPWACTEEICVPCHSSGGKISYPVLTVPLVRKSSQTLNVSLLTLDPGSPAPV